MKAGKVVSIRVSPKDCLSILDLLELVPGEGASRSFSSRVSVALSALLEDARQRGTLVPHSGFSYAERMQPFVDTNRVARLDLVGALRSEPAAATDEMTQEQRLAATQLEILIRKKEEDAVNYNDKDAREYDKCYQILYGPQ